jgi:hypothetical protein
VTKIKNQGECGKISYNWSSWLIEFLYNKIAKQIKGIWLIYSNFKKVTQFTSAISYNSEHS